MRPTSLNRYEDAMEQWLRAAGLDVSVRFLGSHFRIDIWTARSYAWIPVQDAMAKMNEILDEGFGYRPRHILTWTQMAAAAADETP
jgi:hypothetical protein